MVALAEKWVPTIYGKIGVFVVPQRGHLGNQAIVAARGKQICSSTVLIPTWTPPIQSFFWMENPDHVSSLPLTPICLQMEGTWA